MFGDALTCVDCGYSRYPEFFWTLWLFHLLGRVRPLHGYGVHYPHTAMCEQGCANGTTHAQLEEELRLKVNMHGTRN